VRTITCLFFTVLAAAQDPDFDKARIAAGAPGAAMAILRDGKIETRVSGVASVETNAPVTAASLFRIGSTAKMFTAAAIAILAEQGKLQLDAPISKYASGLAPELRAITLHQLLTHTSGLADDAPMDGPHDDSALAERVRGWGRDALFTEPGRIFSYANTGYALAAYVLEQVYGKPFADAVRELVLEPCGMKSSTYRPLVAMTFPLALGHHPGPNGPDVVRPFADHAGTWAAGSLFTSAADYARFAQALLDGGRIDGKQSLPAAAVARIQTAHVDIPALNRRYGYGLQVYDEDGARVVRHTGGRMGYDSVMHLIPSKKVGVLVLGNRTGASFYSYARRVAQDAAGIRGTPGERPPETSTVDAAESARLAGKYVNGRISMELAVRDGALQAQLGGRWFAVRKSGPGRFHAPGAGPLTEFQILDGSNRSPEFLVAEVWALRRMP